MISRDRMPQLETRNGLRRPVEPNYGRPVALKAEGRGEPESVEVTVAGSILENLGDPAKQAVLEAMMSAAQHALGNSGVALRLTEIREADNRHTTGAY